MDDTCKTSYGDPNYIKGNNRQMVINLDELKLTFNWYETLTVFQILLYLGTTSIPTFVTQNGEWPLGGGGGGLSNGRFAWTKCDFCSEVKKMY